MESNKTLKERIENFLAHGGSIEEFTQLYVDNGEGSADDVMNVVISSFNTEGSIFDKIGRSIENIWKTIVNVFTTLWTWLGNILTAIGNIASSIIDGIGAFFTTLWTWLGDILSAIGNIVTNLVNGISDLLKNLFIPENNPFESLSNKFDEKFSFINQIKNLFSSLLGFNNYGSDVPSFEVTYFNTTVSIIDFSLFIQYRDWIHGIILAISWVIFITKTYRKLPGIIGGFSQ